MSVTDLSAVGQALAGPSGAGLALAGPSRAGHRDADPSAIAIVGAGAAWLSLDDGRRLRVLPVHTGAAPLMAAFVGSLTDEARYLRFFQPVPRVTERFARNLCDVDQIDHVAWLLLDGPTPVAEARAVASSAEPGSAELAVAVHHGWRRGGVASTALRALGAVVARRGIHTFTASVLASNRASAALVRSLGLELSFADGELAGRGPVPAWSGSPAELAALVAAQAAAARSASRQEAA